MASDQVVLAKDVLRALSEIKRLGAQRVLEDLEQQEVDLTEFMLEEVCGIHQQILKAGVPSKEARLVNARVEALALVLVTSLRTAHVRLWEAEAGEIVVRMGSTRLSDPPAAEDTRPPDEQASRSS
jgi:hypothetical protein